MKNIYLVGIKGVGMTALAVYLSEKGYTVLGSDVSEVFPTDKILSQFNIKVVNGFKPENITDDIDLVVTTAAHQGINNIEVKTALEKNIPVKTYAQYLGELMNDHKIKISVCGCHGKTTTSSLLAYVFHQAGLSSSHIVGVPEFSGLTGGHYGGDDYIIVEADEYVACPGINNTPKFMFQTPDYIICTNIDWDHPDIYKDLNAVKTAFLKFFLQSINKNRTKIIYNSDDKNLLDIIKHLPIRYLIGYSPDNANTSQIKTIINQLGIKIENSDEIISKFSGVSRRFERIYHQDTVYLYDDYAHHPAEINFLIKKAKEKFPDKKIIFIFKSHTYSRTAALEVDFIRSLSGADKTYLLDIFASARENSKDFNITSKSMAKKAEKQGIKNIFYTSEGELIVKLTEDVAKGNCIIVTVGAGDLYKFHKLIISIINKI